MSDTTSDNVRLMTNEAEAGQGSALNAQLQSMSFEDIVTTLKSIESLNAQDRKANASIPPLYFNADYATVTNGSVDIWADLYRAAPGSTHSWGTNIFDASYTIPNKPGAMPVTKTNGTTIKP